MRRITITFPWPLTVSETREVLTFAFQVALVTYLGCYLIESLQPGFISTSISLNTILWWVIGFGVGAMLWPVVTPPPQTTYVWTRGKVLEICIFAFLSAFIVYLQSGQAVWKLSLLIAVSVGLIVAGICYLLYFGGSEPIHHLSKRNKSDFNLDDTKN